MESHPSASPRQDDRLRVFMRERHRALLLIACFIIIVVGFRLLLPSLIERGTAYGSRYYLGLPARIDRVSLSILKGSIVLDGVSVASVPDTVTPRSAAFNPPGIDPSIVLLHFQRIAVKISWWALFKKTIRLTDVSIDGPSIRVLREAGGKIDPISHAKPLAQPTKPAKVRENPSSKSWAVAINQFVLRAPSVMIVDPSAGRNLLDFSLESFSLDDVSVRGSDFSLGAVSIQGPVLRVQKDLVIANSSDNPAPVKSAEGKTAENSKAPPDSLAPGYRIKKVDVERAKFTWISKEGPLDVTLTLKASNITADEGKHFPISLALQIANGTIGLNGEAGILPPSYSGKFTWNGLPFPPILLASMPDLAAWLHSADCSGDMTIKTDIAGIHGPPSISLTGHSTIETLSIADPGNKEISLGWKQLEVVVKDAFIPIPGGAKSLPTTKVNFELIRLVEPKISYTHPAPALNALLGIFPASNAPTAVTSSPPSSGSSPVEAKIALLELTGGNIEVHNTIVKPTAISMISDLSISVRGLNYPDPSADAISIQAMLPSASVLAIDGSLKPGNVGSYTLSLKNLDLPPFNPYAAAAGASLDTGQVSVTTKLNTQGPIMQIDNDLVLQKFGISLLDPNSFARNFGVPIDLAIALLSDRSGDIKLTIPLRVDEKGSSVSKSTVIASAIKAAIIGAVSTPLKLLGGSFGGNSGSAAGSFTIAPIKSPKGSADLDPGASARIDGLVKLLARRPAMGLMLRGRTSIDDRPLVAEQLLIERLKAGKGLPKLDGAGFLAQFRIKQILFRRGKGKSATVSLKDQPLFDRYLASVEIPEDRLDTLAKLRAEKFRDMLLAKGVNATRLQIGNREAVGEAGVVISFLSQKGAVVAK